MAKSTDENSEKEKDSLKTHPDCKMRIKKLTAQVQQYSKNTARINIVNDSLFQQLRYQFDYEIIEYCYSSGNVSRSLYYTLQMQEFYPSDVYLITNTIRCLNKMYEAQKNHIMGKITDMPSPYQEDKYNNFLQFLNRLHLQDIVSLSYYYMLQFSQRFTSDKNFQEQEKLSRSNYSPEQ